MSEEKTESRGLLAVMGERYNIASGNLLPALKKVWGNMDESSMIGLCIVANQYGLNPFTNEIYAFQSRKTGKIVPIVGIDGWSRIINEHPQFDGLEVTVSPDGESATCTIWRKDRNHPITVTEYKRECYQTTSDVWKNFPLRMLRHKAIIQCARVAFGYTGLYDPDEASTFATPVKQSSVEKQVDELTAKLQGKLNESEPEPQPEQEVIDAEFTTEKPLEECTLQEFVDRAKNTMEKMQGGT